MRRIARALGVVAGALLLAGCWPVPGADVNRSNHNPFEKTLTSATVAGLTEQWRYTSPVGPVTAPVVSRGGVHVGTRCTLVTLNPRTGAEVGGGLVVSNWNETQCGPNGFGQPGEPYVYDTPGGQRVQLSTGSVVPLHTPNFLSTWETRDFDVATSAGGAFGGGYVVARRGDQAVSSTVTASGPATADNTVSVAGRSFLLDTYTWFSAPWPATGLTLGSDKLFHAGWAVLATAPGPATWGFGVRGYSPTEARPGCGPATGGFPPGDLGPVECPVWATPTDGAPTPPVLSADGATLYTRTSAGTLYAIATATGAVQWTASGLGSAGAPALGGGTLFVPTDTGKVLLFQAGGCGAATCSPLSPVGFDTGSGAPIYGVAVAGDVIYAVSGGQVYASGECFPEEYCLLAWHDEGYGAPVISAGQLYVTDGNTSLIAYGLDS